jgi:quinolinate synthase
MRFNTAISKLMVFARDIGKSGPLPRESAEAFVLLLAPMAPHLAEELWSRLGHEASLARESWPTADPALLVEDEITLVVQVNGKKRGEIQVPADVSEDRARELALGTPVEIITWKGHCEVHERFTGDELRAYRDADPGVKIIAHPECAPDVIEEADFTGSTSGMIKWVEDNQPSKVLLVTECSMSDNVAVEAPNVEFVRPCNLCPHMKRITLPKILESLVFLKEEVTVDPAIAGRARAAVERMINLNP